MGDYDHPEERISAEKVLNERLKSYPEKTWEKVWNLLKAGGKFSKFYNLHFHTMKEEYKN